MKAYIKAISYYLPPTALSNKELCEVFPNLTEADIYKKTGIKKRHITSEGIVGSDLGFFAAEKLFEEHNIDRKTIDYIIFCTEGLDYKGPVTACVLQDRLQLNTTCGAIDLPYGCTGFTYCISIAKALIESGQATNVLALTSDIPSTVIHPEDADLRMLFGDAGAATLITATENETIAIGSFSVGTDGSGAENLMVKGSGTRGPVDQEWLDKYDNVGGLKYGRMQMNALEIFNFALRIVPPLIESILAKNKLEKSEINLFVFHQANAFLLSVLRRKLKIEEDRFFIYMEEVGNTVSASIPIALAEAIKCGKAKKGDKVLIAAFGIGYSWSGTVITI